MRLLTGLEPALDFPRQDLTEINAQMLELMLANADMVALYHKSAEDISWVFRAVHPAITKVGKRLFSDPSRAEAFDHGISTYEAINALVLQEPAHTDVRIVTGRAKHMANIEEEAELFEYVDNARSVFVDEMQHTTELIVTSSKRRFSSAATYAVYGAAAARQFELDTAV